MTTPYPNFETGASPHLQRDRSIDLLRGFAVLLVLFFHVWPEFFPGGYAGVDLFFVISGFLMAQRAVNMSTASTVSSLAKTVVQFVGQRFWRLWPPMILVVATCSIGGLFFLGLNGPLANSIHTAAASVFGFANVVAWETTNDYFDFPLASNAFMHLWSVSVEIQLYTGLLLLVGFAVFLREAFQRVEFESSLRWLFVWLAVLSFAASVLGAMDLVNGAAADFLLGYYSPVTRFWEFAAGALLVWAKRSAASVVLSRFLVWGTMGGLSLFVLADFGRAPMSAASLSAVITGVAWLHLRKAAPGPTGVVRILAMVGVMSYSLYLWHWPLIVLGRGIDASGRWDLSAVFLAAVLSALTYRGLERLSARRALRQKPVRASLALIVMLMVPILVLSLGSEGSSLDRNYYELSPAEFACDFPDDLIDGCKWEPDPGDGLREPDNGIVYLVGDSHAHHYSEGIIPAAISAGSALKRVTKGSCPFFLSAPETSVRLPDTCQSHNRNVMDWLVNSAPGVVVLSFSSGYWLDENLDDKWVGEPSVLADRMLDTVSELRQAGHSVILIKPVPRWPKGLGVGTAFCSAYRAIDTECVSTLRLEEFPGRREIDEVFALLGQSGTGLDVIDFAKQICPTGLCQSRVNNEWVYVDSGHLSRDFAKRLEPYFSSKLTR